MFIAAARRRSASRGDSIDHRIGRLTIAPLDLAALLCSRVCHDVISPVGAIINGLEVLDDEDDAEMRTVAMELIKKSAAAASARLQFCRLAFGAAGSLTAAIDTGDAENAARAVIANDRTTLRWDAPRRLAPKNSVKLLLNLCLVAAGAAPRGGVVIVDMTGEGDDLVIRVSAAGSNVRLSQAAAGALAGSAPETIDGHSIQPYYTKLLASECGLAIEATATPDSLTLTAKRAPAPRAAQASSNASVGD
jgi:histidine phosphotransferase ChpT